MAEPNKKRILLVEDDATISDLVAYNLRRAGYEVLQEHNGRAGLRDRAHRRRRPGAHGPDAPRSGRHGRQQGDRRGASPACPSSCSRRAASARPCWKASSPGPTTTSPSRSTSTCCWPASRRACGAPRPASPWPAAGAGGRRARLSTGDLVLDRDAHTASGPRRARSPSIPRSTTCWSCSSPARATSSPARRSWSGCGTSATLPASRSLDVHVRRLRAKLEQIGAEVELQTVRGVGYRLAPHATEGQRLMRIRWKLPLAFALTTLVFAGIVALVAALALRGVFLDRLEDDMSRQAQPVRGRPGAGGRRLAAAPSARRTFRPSPRRPATPATSASPSSTTTARCWPTRRSTRPRWTTTPTGRRCAQALAGHEGRARRQSATLDQEEVYVAVPLPASDAAWSRGRAADRPAGQPHRRHAGRVVADPAHRVGGPAAAHAGRVLTCSPAPSPRPLERLRDMTARVASRRLRLPHQRPPQATNWENWPTRSTAWPPNWRPRSASWPPRRSARARC